MILPDWLQCCDRVEAGTANALEKFIYDNEPANMGPGFQSDSDFREGLRAVIEELLAGCLTPSATDAGSS